MEDTTVCGSANSTEVNIVLLCKKLFLYTYSGWFVCSPCMYICPCTVYTGCSDLHFGYRLLSFQDWFNYLWVWWCLEADCFDVQWSVALRQENLTLVMSSVSSLTTGPWTQTCEKPPTPSQHRSLTLDWSRPKIIWLSVTILNLFVDILSLFVVV